MNYWLIKSEPSVFSFDHLLKAQKQTTFWDGVRNYQARNMLRDQMKIGDQVFFYHSSCDEPGIVGLCEVTKAGYPDHTAFDPKDHHYDPKSKRDTPTWYGVDLRALRAMKRPISLERLKSNPALCEFALVRPGNRLSVMPVTAAQWREILKMEAR